MNNKTPIPSQSASSTSLSPRIKNTPLEPSTCLIVDREQYRLELYQSSPSPQEEDAFVSLSGLISANILRFGHSSRSRSYSNFFGFPRTFENMSPANPKWIRAAAGLVVPVWVDQYDRADRSINCMPRIQEPTLCRNF